MVLFGLSSLYDIVRYTVLGYLATFSTFFRYPTISQPLSNGTHIWEPTVILLSLDGFKPAYLDTDLTPFLHKLTHNGKGISYPWHIRSVATQAVQTLSAEYMLPVSPSLTFPNHWALQTGLQPSSNGIIANDFHLLPFNDGQHRPNSSFYYTDPRRSWDAKWWKGIPIWEHLELSNLRTANLMWPGPPVTERGGRSSIFQKYEKGWTLSERRDQILQWLDLEGEVRPQFICAYAPDVDTATHNYGPNPTLKPVMNALSAVDSYVKDILTAIDQRNATSIVNIVIVSDHGMTFTSNDKLIYLDHILDTASLNAIVTLDGWPNVGMRFSSRHYLAKAHKRLLEERDAWQARGIDAFDVVDRAQLVSRFNWTDTDLVRDRVGDLWILPSVGWSVTTHDEMLSFNFDYGPKGNHGYDANHPDMHAFFAATGPSIKDREDPRIPAFRNLEIHNLVMAMLGVSPTVNDGTPGFWKDMIEKPKRQKRLLSTFF